MKKIGIIGLGVMGHGMAKNFLQHGHQLVVWNRDSKKAEDLVANGAMIASSPKEVASSADVLFEITAHDESSRSVWLGDDGILAGAHDSSVLIASSTLSIDWIDELAQLSAKSGHIFMDAPLTGGRIAAESGSLTMLFGGDESQIDLIREDLQSIASKVLYFGPVGHGMRYKLILNFLQAVHIIGFGQAMKMAKSSHMDEQKVASALLERPGGVITSIAKTAYFQKPDPTTFSISWIKKDLMYAQRYFQPGNADLLSEVLRAYEKAVDSGYGLEDWASINTLPAGK